MHVNLRKIGLFADVRHSINLAPACCRCSDSCGAWVEECKVLNRYSCIRVWNKIHDMERCETTTAAVARGNLEAEQKRALGRGGHIAAQYVNLFVVGGRFWPVCESFVLNLGGRAAAAAAAAAAEQTLSSSILTLNAAS
jgi:hypothetical protein